MRWLLMFLFLGVVLGCGDSSPQPPEMGGEDGKQIAELVEQLNDDSTSAAKLKAAFATGTTLSKAELSKFPLYRYDLKGMPHVSGTSATAKIDVILNLSSESKGEKDWTFVKEGDKWKIKSAPLP
ncbi:MAG: hypothetical protein L0241_26455 [Planctomycetia bacterium]|nr:hypothetical protein [Planctomycetia bacterium]